MVRVGSSAARRAAKVEREGSPPPDGGVWFDYRQTDRLRDEAPGAYKDIRAVVRAQRDLVKVTRVL